MKSLLSEITQELTEEQQKIVDAIDITKTEDEIMNNFVNQNIVSFKVKDYDDDQKNQNNQ
jgi:hypothetical protein